jgi:hypothetical protein
VTSKAKSILADLPPELAAVLKQRIAFLKEMGKDWDGEFGFARDVTRTKAFASPEAPAKPGWEATLTPEELREIKEYTSSQSKYNAPLRHSGSWNIVLTEAKLKILDRAIGKAGKYDAPIVVYRGTRFDQSFIEAKLVPGLVFKDEGYFSTSFDTDTALGFSGSASGSIVFEILATRGASVENITRVRGEHELLMKRGTRFLVLDIIEDGQMVQSRTQKVVTKRIVRLLQLKP